MSAPRIATVLAALACFATSPATQDVPRATDAAPPAPLQIDRVARSVSVSGEIVLREGGLEFFACFPGKEHESIVRLDCTAADLRNALIEIGLKPGKPPRVDAQTQRRIGPEGDLVDVFVETRNADGTWRRRSAMDWIREIETLRPALTRPWVFTGSIQLNNGALAADQTGACVSVVDKSDALFGLTQFFISRLSQLWAEANTPAIPPIGTRVRVVFKPAAPLPHTFAIDRLGRPRINGEFVADTGFVDLLQLACRTHNEPPTICWRRTFYVERRRWNDRLRRAGIAARFIEADATATRPASAPGTTQPSMPTE